MILKRPNTAGSSGDSAESMCTYKIWGRGWGGALRATEGTLKTVWSEGQLSEGQLRSEGAEK